MKIDRLAGGRRGIATPLKAEGCQGMPVVDFECGRGNPPVVAPFALWLPVLGRLCLLWIGDSGVCWPVTLPYDG